MRRLLLSLGFAGLLAVLAAALPVTGAASRPRTIVSRADAIRLLDETRASIDETLALIKAGNAEQALAEAKYGYLSHFELVETPLRVADNDLTVEAEFQFAAIRTAIQDGRPIDEIRDQIVELRGMLDEAERAITDAGVGAPAFVTTQSFLILFREGFEIVLLLSVLLGYLEAARSPHFIKPILGGVALAAVATVITVLLMPTIFAILPVGREVLGGGGRADRGRRAVLRVVLADRPDRAQPLDGVRPGPAVERDLGRVDRVAGRRRVHRGVPRGFRDGAVLPVAADVRRRSRQLHPARRRPRSRRPHRRRRRGVPARPQAARAHVHEHRRRRW